MPLVASLLEVLRLWSIHNRRMCHHPFERPEDGLPTTPTTSINEVVGASNARAINLPSS